MSSKRVPPLVLSDLAGKPYTRRASVEAEILLALDRPRTDWPALAMLKGEKRLSHETLVFLIRQIRNSDSDLLRQLVYELTRRTVQIAKHWAKGFTPGTTKEILEKATEEIVILLLKEDPSRSSEFIEMAFETAVKNRTLNIVEKHRRDALSGPCVSLGVTVQDDVFAQIPDKRPLPDEVASKRQKKAWQAELVRRASTAVTDPRHLEAVILRYCHRWPITDKDPAKQTLATYFGMSGRQIRNWIRKALAEMRDAIGDDK